MMKCSFTPYEGNSSYIFVSYSHKDSERVFPILEQLNNKGFRVWYDEGIEWGSEWPESVASHLYNSTVCMFFHSKNSINSRNCRQELYYANKEGKNLFSVYLEDVKLNHGLDMQISAFQATFLYQYDDTDKFYENLFKTETLKDCHGEMTGINNKSLFNTSVFSIPDGTVKIKNYEFYGNDTIKQFYIPDSVKIIGKNAFSDAKIESFIGMNGVKKIGNHAFSRQGKNIPIKEPLEEIGEWAFAYVKLSEVEIPNSVVKISEGAFSASSLKKVIINGKIKQIPPSAFWECRQLETVIIHSAIQKIGQSAFCSCTNLSEIFIPYGLRRIEKKAFAYCYGLKEISVPDTVQYIGEEAFMECTSLESVTIPQKVRTIGKNAFKGTTALGKIVIPRSLEKYIPLLVLGNDFQEKKFEKYTPRQIVLVKQ